ncbi:hypothetical protein [Sphingomonas sp. Root710]|uniref:hypothetical protein n=1 Tax=Sphingomonas sp. Root710 TaxID=1736594 RepID=UPI0012E376CA|nr:hypothetical protein [Sphingomonas sp. Root710]
MAREKQSGATLVRARGFDLLRQVYDELYTHLSDDFSPAELLKAAQTLIDVTNEEYSNQTYQDGRTNPGYFSYDVDRMILDRSWWALENESINDDLGDERFYMDFKAVYCLRQYYNPERYLHRG